MSLTFFNMAKMLHKHLVFSAKLRKALFYIVGFWWCLKEMDGMVTVQKWVEKSNLMINLANASNQYKTTYFKLQPKEETIANKLFNFIFDFILKLDIFVQSLSGKNECTLVFLPLHQNFFITMGWLLFNTSKHSFDGFITSYFPKHCSNPFWQSCGFHW